MNVMLVITLFIIIFCILQGYRKGILGFLYGIISCVFMLIFVAVAHTPIENALRENTSIYETIYEKTSEHISEKQTSTGLEEGVEDWWESLVGDLPDSQALLGSIELPNGMDVATLTSLGTDYIVDYEAEIIDSVTKSVADFIMRGIGIICTVIIGSILLLLLRKILKGIGKLPVLREANSFLGLFMGAIVGVLLVWVVMYIGALLVTTDLGQAMVADISESEFLTFLYDHNLIVTILEYV